MSYLNTNNLLINLTEITEITNHELFPYLLLFVSDIQYDYYIQNNGYLISLPPIIKYNADDKIMAIIVDYIRQLENRAHASLKIKGKMEKFDSDIDKSLTAVLDFDFPTSEFNKKFNQ